MDMYGVKPEGVCELEWFYVLGDRISLNADEELHFCRLAKPILNDGESRSNFNLLHEQNLLIGNILAVSEMAIRSKINHTQQ